MDKVAQQLLLMGGEALLVACLLLAFFHFRATLGVAPLHATLAVFYQLAIVLSGTFFFELNGELLMNPGTIVLFPAVVFTVIFVYIRDDSRHARHIVYGLVGANLVVGIVALLLGRHLQSAMSWNEMGAATEIFERHPRLLAAGTAALLLDVVLTVVAYDRLGRFLSRLPYLRIYVASALVLLVETTVYVTAGFWGSPGYGPLLVSAVAGKLIVTVVYSLALSLYLRFTAKEDGLALPQTATEAAFPTLTYREKYERLQRQSMRDPLTGLFNRGTFDDLIGAQLVKCARTGKSLSLLMVDIDHFKGVNDIFGHQEGDEVLRTVGRAIQQSLRMNDFACRFGGEEFAVLLPDADARHALNVADRMRRAVTDECRLRTAAGTVQPLTISVGVASAPDEAATAEGLIKVADGRLYEAKRAGRDRVSHTGKFAPLPPTSSGNAPADENVFPERRRSATP